MMSENLLDDTIVLILRRLPPESLLRFKSVSKSWCQLIESPQFIIEHYETRASISNNGCIIVKLERRNYFSLVYNHSEGDLKHLHDSGYCLTVVAPCNGIFCLFLDCLTILLCNPAIGQYKTLPRSLMLDLEPPENFYCTNYHILGLNFDPKSNGYKVVRIWAFTRRVHSPRPLLMDDYMTKVEVWTPGSNSWRQIDAVPQNPLIMYDGPINLKGRCYWLAGYIESRVIVAFDMMLEAFQATPLPDALRVKPINKCKYMRLAILNESIVVFSTPLQHSPECFDVLLMNGSDHGSWSKYMTVEMPPLGSIPKSWKNKFRNPEPYMMYPLAFWNNGELILRDKFGRLVFLNTSTGKAVHSEFRINVQRNIYVYSESLVSINEWVIRIMNDQNDWS